MMKALPTRIDVKIWMLRYESEKVFDEHFEHYQLETIVEENTS